MVFVIDLIFKFCSYGHLTWEWTKGIRSYLLPMIIAGVYKVLEILKLDEVQLLVCKRKRTLIKFNDFLTKRPFLLFQVLVPRILQAILTAFSDYRFHKWCGSTKWSVFVMATSWFVFYTGSRTLSNTIEMSLTTIALSYFPWETESAVFILPATLVCYMRPTAITIWLPLFFYHLKTSRYHAFGILMKRYVPIGLLVVSAMIGIDSYASNQLLITPWEFFKLNVLEDIGSFYGTHTWHWYFAIGLPTTLGITTIPFLLATSQSIRNRKTFPVQNILLLTIFINLGVYSLLPHKEFRFVLPVIPMCLYISSQYLTRWSRKASKFVLWVVAIGILVGNLVPAVYLGTVHQKGTLDVMPHLATIAREFKGENDRPAKIMFMMPCHSTPYYSHIHANVTMRFLRCEPNWKKQENYVDEADQFYRDPMQWIRTHLPTYPRTSLPTHLVVFDNLVPRIQDFLTTYKPILTLFHSDVRFDLIFRQKL